ncbi:MAG: hypothetical protein WC765_01400 [Phycisphaerae bacterium]
MPKKHVFGPICKKLGLDLDMGAFTGFLPTTQVFSGKSDPVSIIQNGTPEQIGESVRKCRAAADG